LRVRRIGRLTAIVLLAATCDAQQRPVEAPLQILNPHYVTISESIVVDAPFPPSESKPPSTIFPSREESAVPVFLNADHTHSLAKAVETAKVGLRRRGHRFFHAII